MSSNKILIVDDDKVFLHSLEKVLSTLGYLVVTENASTEVENKVKTNSFDVVLLDVKMPGLNGIELLEKIISHDPTLPVILVSGQSTINIAVEAMKLGAFDFVEKPIDKNRMEPVLRNAFNFRRISKENLFLNKEIESNYEMVGDSSEIKSIFKKINSIAKTNAKVLITGETGTGKELVARAIHRHSNRADQPYIKVNCAAIPNELLESELFGHKKGSFTGATHDREGKFKVANGGTLFLDEIGDMDYKLQAKILRALEENEIEVVGENTSQEIDVRIIAATNKLLTEEIDNGNFREDLFHRLNVINIHIPPLRYRKDDIKPLLYHFLSYYNMVYNKSILGFSHRAISIMQSFDWKGNVRELRNFVEKLVIYSNTNFIEVSNVLDLLNETKPLWLDSDILEFKEAKLKFEKDYIINALANHDGKIFETAVSLGLDRSHLFKKMKALGIEKF